MAKKNEKLVPAGGVQFEQLIRLAWSGQLNLTQLFEAANELTAKGGNDLAVVLYQTWLKRNVSPFNYMAQFNLGVILLNEGDTEGARDAYARSLAQAPEFLQSRFNLGLVYERMGLGDSAIAQWLWIESHADAGNAEQRPLLLLALNNLGRHYEDGGRFAEALASLTKSLRLEPNQPDAIHHWVFLRAKQCVWPVYSPLPGLSEAMQREHTSALAMISLSEDPAAQLTAARHYVQSKLATGLPRLAPTKPYGHKRLRIAYCSSDFCLHPVAMLTAELLELHDRKRFEVFAFDWSREDGSALRQRVINGVDHFERIHHLSDEAAARLIRDKEIDILVDLQGQTLGARANMLSYRPAPIQVTYLGLPATTGLPSIDYVIADRFLIPEEAREFYSEKPLYLPDIYQTCDRKRESSKAPSRQDCGLPEQGFVFCSFNNNYKYTPEMFLTWMKILLRVPGSVLWLLADNVWARENMRNAASAAGVDADRLIFGSRVAPADYLARYEVADLFLDSYPFNGGTTANDALWMGLPVLTRSGKTFASRMAGALLTAAGLDKLITYDQATYENKAVALASSPETLQEIKKALVDVRHQNGVLFDMPRLVRHLEDQFVALYKAQVL